MKYIIFIVMVLMIPYLVFSMFINEKPIYMGELNLTEIEKRIISAQVKYEKTEGDTTINTTNCAANVLTQSTITKIVIHHTVVDGDTDIIYEAISRAHKKRWEKGSKIFENMPINMMEEVKGKDGGYMMYHRLIGKDGKIVGDREITQVGWGGGGKDNCNNINTYHIAMVGNFQNTPPTQAQYDSLNVLIDGIRAKYGDVQIYGHGQMEGEATACPGKLFDYNKIKGYKVATKQEIVVQKEKEVIAKEEGLLGTFDITRYYSCDQSQLTYLSWEIMSLRAKLGREPSLSELYNECNRRQFNGDIDNTQPKYGARYTNADAGISVACPPTVKAWTKLKIDGYDKIVTCRDVGSAIKNKRLDLYVGIGDRAVKNYSQFPSGLRKIRIVN